MNILQITESLKDLSDQELAGAGAPEYLKQQEISRRLDVRKRYQAQQAQVDATKTVAEKNTEELLMGGIAGADPMMGQEGDPSMQAGIAGGMQAPPPQGPPMMYGGGLIGFQEGDVIEPDPNDYFTDADPEELRQAQAEADAFMQENLFPGHAEPEGILQNLKRGTTLYGAAPRLDTLGPLAYAIVNKEMERRGDRDEYIRRYLEANPVPDVPEFLRQTPQELAARQKLLNPTDQQLLEYDETYQRRTPGFSAAEKIERLVATNPRFREAVLPLLTQDPVTGRYSGFEKVEVKDLLTSLGLDKDARPIAAEEETGTSSTLEEEAAAAIANAADPEANAGDRVGDIAGGNEDPVSRSSGIPGMNYLENIGSEIDAFKDRIQDTDIYSEYDDQIRSAATRARRRASSRFQRGQDRADEQERLLADELGLSESRIREMLREMDTPEQVQSRKDQAFWSAFGAVAGGNPRERAAGFERVSDKMATLDDKLRLERGTALEAIQTQRQAAMDAETTGRTGIFTTEDTALSNYSQAAAAFDKAEGDLLKARADQSIAGEVDALKAHVDIAKAQAQLAGAWGVGLQQAEAALKAAQAQIDNPYADPAQSERMMNEVEDILNRLGGNPPEGVDPEVWRQILEGFEQSHHMTQMSVLQRFQAMANASGLAPLSSLKFDVPTEN
jgi:hypothetical protein